MKYIYIYNRLLVVFLLAICIFLEPLSAAKINIHITTGGLLFTDYGVPSRLPKYVGNTPAPIVPGTEDVLDCHAISQDNPDYLKTTEAGALCNAVAQLQKHIKDPVELDIEFVIGDLQSIWPGTLAATIVTYLTGYPNQANKNMNHIAFDAVVNQLKKKNAQDLKNNPLISHLPSYNQLNAILPDDPYYRDNPDFKNNQWRPKGVALSTAQLKAVGIKPNFYSVPCACAANVPFYLKNTGMDFGLVLTDDSVPNSFFSLDFDITDGVGIQGPYSRAVYNSIDYTNPATWPPGFVLSPRYIDLQGVVMHELSHGLGFLSKVGPISDYAGDIAYPPPSTDEFKSRQSVTALDLFRFKDSDAALIKKANDFRSAPRFWALDTIVDPSCNYDKGTAVAVLDIGKNGPLVAPLANGYYLDPITFEEIPGIGDGRQTGHFRDPFNRVPVNPSNCNSATKGLFFFEDPPGRMMRPASGQHNPTLLTNDDLTALDVIGWNIDYDGNQPTVLDPYDPLDLNSALTPQAQFEQANGITFQPGVKVIVE